MSKTREEVAAIVREICLDAIESTKAEGFTDGHVQSNVNNLMNRVPALRLAEKAEENRDYRLAVVDTHPSQALWQHPDYRRAIEVAPSTTEVRE